MKVIKNKTFRNITQRIRGVFRADNNSSIPPIEEIFKCIAFRIAGGNLTPRISHITGDDPLNPEGYVPRLSCLKGLFAKEEETATIRHVRAKPVRTRVVPPPARAGFGVGIPAKSPKVRAVPPSAPVKRAPVRAAPLASVKKVPAPVRVKRAPQPQPQLQSQPRYIIKP